MFRNVYTTAVALAAATCAPAYAQTELAPTVGAESDLSALYARAELQHVDGSSAGTAHFTELPSGLLIEVELEGLSEGPHGIHIHETGACTPDFAAANGHAAPQGREHGFAATDTPHAGDLPNIVVGADGRAAANYLNTRATLSEGEGTIIDTDDAALIVHTEADSYRDEAGAGDRVACGVIRVEG